MIFENFSLGWQNRARQELMKDEALFRCVDLSLLELGNLRCIRNNKEESFFKGQGYTSEVYNIYQLDVEGSSTKLIYYTVDGSLYRYNSITNTATELSSGINEKNVSYASFKPLLSIITYVYITDGTTMLCDTGVHSYTWGIDPPQNPLKGYMYGDGGSLIAGDYTWQYTFYDEDTGAESDPCPLMGPVTAVDDDSADVKGIEISANARVTSRRLYRSLVDGGSHYLVRDIGDNVTTSFIDVDADTSLTTLMKTDQGVPATFGKVKNFQNRLFGTVNDSYPNRVWYSRGSRPDNWPKEYYLEIGTADDRVLDMLEFEGTLFFLQTGAISGMYGTTPDTFAWYKTRSHMGVAGKYSASAGPDGVYFLGYDGVYRFDGVKSMRVSEQIGQSFGKLAKTWVPVVDWDSVVEYCRSCFLNGVFYIILPMVDSDGIKSNTVFSYDVFQQLWTELGMDLDFIYSDVGRGKVYGSMYEGTGYSVYELLEENSLLNYYNDPSPEFVTKCVEFGRAKDGSRVKWLRKFRVEAVGDWTLYFYVDDVLRYTKALTGLTNADKYIWYDLDDNIKGLQLYVRGVAGSGSTPVNRSFSSLEVE